MPQSAIEVGVIHRSQQSYPTKVQRIKEIEGDGYWQLLGVGELRPRGLVVRFDGRLVLGERELEPRVCIQVTVWNVMDNLFYGPSPRTVPGLQLIARQASYRGAERTWRLGDLSNECRVVLLVDRGI